MSHRFQHEEEILAKAYDATLARRLLGYLSPYKFVVGLSVLLLLLVSLSELVGPYLVKVAVDEHISKGDASGLPFLALLYTLSLVAAFVLGYWQVFLMNRTGQRVMADLRNEIFSHLQRLSISFFDKNPVGRLLTRVTNDVEVLNELVTTGVVAIFGDIFTLVGISIVLVAINLRLAMVIFLLIPLIFVAAIVFRRKARMAYNMTRVRIARLNAFLQETLSGMRIVQAFAREPKTMAKFDRLNASHCEAYLKSIHYHAVFFPVMELIAAAAVALIIWYGGARALQGTLTLGGLVAFLQYTRRFFRPITDLSEKYNAMQAAMASSERIFTLLDTQPEILDSAAPLELRKVEGNVEFENVSFSYHRGEDVLKNVSFRVDRGETVAIVGATGAGKTTLMNLLSRFYEPQEGCIRVDGVDVRRIPQRQLRENMAVVPQDVFLFSGTIEQNLRLGKIRLSEEEIVNAAEQVRADEFIRRLPRGYKEEVGERGISLSVGQRQLLSFARALLQKPKILILDEATSSVDPETESMIRDALRSLLVERTSIVIAHRLSTIRNADKIIVLHKGSIKEQGTHGELLRKGGIYSRLSELQFGQQEASSPRQ
ncbi:MAG: antibiotic ABC transporter ATP-binding protein [Latescibacteria bacterium DG_63]|nr:MAG: antibiotic ABC transporter ATP-binding protein [Latescibacteria bacterium DG_63]